MKPFDSLAFLLPLLAVPLHAQSLPATRTVSIHAQTLADSTELWASGDDYKVRLDAGVAFVPRLGRSAAVNAEFRWRTLGLAGVGGSELLAVPGATAHSDHVAERDLSFARERYEPLPGGVEQTFAFDRRPALTGDLVLRGAIEGNVTPGERPAQHAPIVCRDSLGRAVVEYGAAFAVDALGRTMPLSTSAVAGEIRIHLPESLLASANYPLTIDPLLSPLLLTSTTAAGSDLDMVVTARTNLPVQYPIAVAHRRVFSATDADVELRVYKDDYSAEEKVFSEPSGSENEESLDLAVGAGGSKWVLAWSRVGSNQPSFYHVHDVGNTAYDPTYYILTRPWGNHDTHPRIGGSLSGATPNVLVVRERFAPGATTSTVVAGLLDLVTHQETTFQLSTTAAFSTASHPTISKDAAGLYWLVAWQSSSGLFPRHRLWGKRVDVSGNVSTATVSSDRAAAPVHEIAPFVGGTLGRYTIAYGEVDQSVSAGLIAGDEAMALRTLRVDWPPLGNLTTQPSQEIAASSQRRLRLMDCAYDSRTRSHWGIAWLDTMLHNLEFAVTGMTGRAVRSEHVYQSASTEHGLWASIAFDPVSWAFFIHYLTGTVDESWSHVRMEVHPDNPVTLHGVPNCSSATPTVGGRFLRGNEFASVQLNNAAPNQLAVLFLSTAAGNVSLDPFGFTGCTLLLDLGPALLGSLSVVTSAAGFAQQTIALPETLLSFDLFAQWAQLAPGANPANITATYGLQIRVR